MIEEVDESNLQLTFHSDSLEESQGFEVIIRRKSSTKMFLKYYLEVSSIKFHLYLQIVIEITRN